MAGCPLCSSTAPNPNFDASVVIVVTNFDEKVFRTAFEEVLCCALNSN